MGKPLQQKRSVWLKAGGWYNPEYSTDFLNTTHTPIQISASQTPQIMDKVLRIVYLTNTTADSSVE